MKSCHLFFRSAWPAVFSGLLSWLAAGPVGAVEAGRLEPASVVEPAQATVTGLGQGAGKPDYRWTLEQLGAREPFRLNGVDDSDSVYFDVRADEIVSGARLRLGYTYSPSLISDLSHINVLLNEVVAVSLPVPKAGAGKLQETLINLPPPLITEFNRLRVQLVGHYTLECEDPLHSSLWANISNRSALELSVDRIALPDDLALLPQPFFDRRDRRRLELPFVLRNADAAVFESAGMVASWFGALASYRGATFPVSLNGALPPKGHAVLFVKGSDPELASLALEKPVGPSLQIRTNPNDRFGKILVITGRDNAELKRAARALVLGQDALSGASAVVTQVDSAEPRKPYDAPNWVRTDRPVKLGELVTPDVLEASGYNAGAIRIPLRLPPDLFGWRAKPVSMDLQYRYSPQVGTVDSTLILNVNDQFLRSFPLLSAAQTGEQGAVEKLWAAGDDLRSARARVDLPLDRLMGRPELQYRFLFDYIKEGQCRDALLDNVRGAIDPESTIDLRGYPHFMPMPDLSAFQLAGFPFTRLADLSETAVMFSSSPAEEEISTYLTLLGRFGESTGYPATAVTVAFGPPSQAVADKDLVVIASGGQGWLAQLDQKLPALLADGKKRFDMSDLQFRARDWITPDPREVERPVRADISYASDGAIAVFAGFESPLQQGRSVVLIGATTPAAQRYASGALLGGAAYEGRMQGSLVAVTDTQIRPLVAEYSYTVGQLDPWLRLEWTLAQYWPGMPPLRNLMLGLGAIVAVMILLAIRGWWRRRRRRLAARPT